VSLLCSWQEFYSKRNPSQENFLFYYKNSIPFKVNGNQGDCYICRSEFVNLTNGAVYIYSSDEIKILIEFSIFFTCCKSNENGSNIMLSDDNANFVISNSVATKSHLLSDSDDELRGLFLYTYINQAQNYNFVVFSSVTDTYQANASKVLHGSTCLFYGQIRVISTNSSYNHCYRYPSFYLQAKDNSGKDLKYSTEDSFVHQCCMMNNRALIRICMRFSSFVQKCEDCVFLNNTQNNGEYGTIWSSGTQQQ
jgi:hypothetical protein